MNIIMSQFDYATFIVEDIYKVVILYYNADVHHVKDVLLTCMYSSEH